MSDRSEAAAARIKETVPILQVLASYGYRVRDDGGDREQQFQCDLHGTGKDNKPSARVYPESNSWYCFACDATRDPIGTVMAKEGVKFWDAIGILEKAYGLDPLPRDYGWDKVLDATGLVDTVLDATKTFDQDTDSIRRLLDNRTLGKDFALEMLLLFWEQLDEVVHRVESKSWTEDQGRRRLQDLKQRVTEALKPQ